MEAAISQRPTSPVLSKYWIHGTQRQRGRGQATARIHFKVLRSNALTNNLLHPSQEEQNSHEREFQHVGVRDNLRKLRKPIAIATPLTSKSVHSSENKKSHGMLQTRLTSTSFTMYELWGSVLRRVRQILRDYRTLCHAVDVWTPHRKSSGNVKIT